MVPGADSYVQPEVERLEYASCLSAMSVPSRAAPRVTVCATADRCPVMVNVCSRVSTVFTGRPSARAAAAVTRSCVHVLALLPKPPPTCWLITRTWAGSSPSTLAMRCAWLIGAWLPVYAVSWSSCHTASTACGSIAWWCLGGCWYVPETVTSLAASASSIEATPSARMSTTACPPGTVALGIPSTKEAAGGRAA